MEKSILYSTNCPKCQVLEAKLNQKQIKYDIIEDINLMKKKNIYSVPVLEIDDSLYDFNAARKLVDEFDPEIGTFESFINYKKAE